MPYRAITPNINVNTESGQLRTELQNTFARLDGQLSSVPFTLYTLNGPTTSIGGGETVLFSYTMETNTVPSQGDSLQILCAGTTTANANAKQIRAYFGSTLVFDSGSQTFNGISWVLRGEIVRNAATSQFSTFDLVTGDTTYKCGALVSTLSKDLTQNQVITITGTGVVNGDITGTYIKILLLSH